MHLSLSVRKKIQIASELFSVKMEGSAFMGGGDVPNKVKKLFEQLHSWNEESQKQFSRVLESHSADIKQGVDDFVSEYNAMKVKLAVARL